jgi:hypothetical protein
MEEIKISPSTSSSQDPKVAAKSVVKPLNSDTDMKKIDWTTKTFVLLAVIILLGIGTGYGIYAQKIAGTVRLAGKDVEVVKTPTEEGVKDASTFKDTAMGTLGSNDGKFTDEGTHVLHQKPGDASQDVFLTSSVVDMSKYVGKKVQVWGETYQGKKAGWLLDVGRIKLL